MTDPIRDYINDGRLSLALTMRRPSRTEAIRDAVTGAVLLAAYLAILLFVMTSTVVGMFTLIKWIAA